jgi:nucleotide-binding universal stress UspA family protein
MILIKNVLVDTDFSEPSEAAVHYGRAFARTFHATLHVLHVVDTVTLPYRVEGYGAILPELQDEVETAARAQLEGLLNEEDRTTLHAKPEIVTDFAKAAAIVGYANEHHIEGEGKSRPPPGSSR